VLTNLIVVQKLLILLCLFALLLFCRLACGIVQT
jgi:hypothetical protein